jgi:arsenite methyltransferase
MASTSEVQEYYGKTLKQSDDLQTNACCTISAYPPHIKKAMANIHDEVMAKYYGCGLTIPSVLAGRRVLDLGSGAGRDCYLASQLVGEDGEVVGVDMTVEQLAVANKHIDHHTAAFNYKKSNVKFLEGNIEQLDRLDLKDDYFDVIISNCVINLAMDKEAVLREAYRTLQVGGELYFSDVYADRRIPAVLAKDPVLYGECLSGALYWNDFINLSKKVGFIDPRSVSSEVITIENDDLKNKLGNIKFLSITYRLFKLPSLESECEDYAQSVTYKGSIPESPESFVLDNNHTFVQNKRTAVCGNTFDMLEKSRLSSHFEFQGNQDQHFGIFEGCGLSTPFEKIHSNTTTSSCC